MVPLAAVTRNNYVESIHYGYVCIIDSSGKILYNLGDYNTKIFFRSCAKPVQVVPLLQSGAAKALNISNKEIAIACASHSGQKIHQETIGGILKKLNLDSVNLHCGIMRPYNEEENKALMAEGKSPSVFHCSCSGKHSAMLALAKFKGYDIEDYEKITNPVQQEILKIVSQFTDEDINSLARGTDGCGAPIYLLPINKIALSYARLVMYSQDTESPYYYSCKTILDSMTQFPEMVAGDYEFCTELMKVTNGKLIGKIGSEAVYCVGIKEGNIGICVKIVDGNERAVYPVVIDILKKLGVLSSSEFNSLKHWHSQKLKNNLGEITGEIIPAFNLDLSSHNINSLLGIKYEL